MSIEIKVPAMGESVTEATVARWFKKEGDAVTRDEPLLELETDKVTVEVPAPADGAIESISVKAGDTVQVGSVLGAIAEGKAGKATPVMSRNPDAVSPIAAPAAPKPAPAPHLLPPNSPPPLTPPSVLPFARGAAHCRGKRYRARARCGLRQGRTRHQGRHAGDARSRARNSARQHPPRRQPAHVPMSRARNACI